LSTQRKLTTLLITLAQFAAVGVCGLRAATPADNAATSPSAQPNRPTMQKPLSREDAELMLREARSAIEQGRLEDADSILNRIEKANVQFPYFHVGPTPTSVRRELMHAQRLRSASKSLAHDQPSGMKRFLPFSRNNGAQTPATTDPFAARNKNADMAASRSDTNLQAAAPAPTQRLANVSGPASATSPSGLQVSPQIANGQTINNPFASAGKTAGAGLANAPSDSAYPATSKTPVDRNANDPADRLALNDVNLKSPQLPNSNTPSSAKPSWTLPDAPLPGGAAPGDRLGAKNTGLTPPKHATPVAGPANSQFAGPLAKQQAQQKLSAARQALEAGNIDLAENLTKAASSLGVPESQFLPDEDRPSLVAWDIAQAKQKENRPKPSVIPAGYRNEQPAANSPPPPVPLPPVARAPQAPLAPPTIQQADNGPQMPIPAPLSLAEKPAKPAASRYSQTPEAPRTEISVVPQAAPQSLPVAASQPPREELPLPPPANLPADNPPATTADNPTANAESLSPPASEIITDNTPVSKPATTTKPPKSLIDSADEAQQVLLRKLYAEVSKRQSEAIRLREKDSERALATLREAQQLVNDSKLPESSRRELSARIDKTLHDTQEYAKAHSSEIALDKRNEQVKGNIDRDRDMKVKLRQKIADDIDEFNRLNHEQRYAEAEIIARRLNEMAPDEPVVKQVWLEAKNRRRDYLNRQLVDKKENSVWEQLNAVENSAVNLVAEDGKEVHYDQKTWEGLVKKRKGSKDRVQHHTERELEIERRLQTPVLLRYQDTPLSTVMKDLSELTGVNIHLDPRGLSQEGVGSDTPITITLAKEISLKSALNLILDQHHLSYVINDEVLKITSDQIRSGEVYAQTYNVADLVTPIPNFVPNSNMGLQGLINDSMAAASRGSISLGNNGPSVIVNDRGKNHAVGPNGNVVAQQIGSTPTSASGINSPTVPIGAGPGGMGAGANADFDSLIDLITGTVATDTWAEGGAGSAEIRPFPTNLSLVISQTQEVHEQIADLLQQLRRLQDLQVTIEVRFIQLNDSFFERSGIDFDMNIVDRQLIGQTPVTGGTTFTPGPPATNVHSATVGLQASTTGGAPNFTSDLDVPFTQGSFAGATVPAIPGVVFDPNTAANFGFAILSDIEAFFLIQAAQGDSRTNILQAPKVTLFNGQQAFVADATQRPFVVGVIPVVGEFAAAQQPVIVVLNEGTMMTIQAVVSDDRRYVRMTIVPFFTQIGDVDTFTFEGSTSSTSSSSSTDNDDDGKNEKKDDSKNDTHSGVTVQLPTFSFISVVTTVSVPDGGTVLLGGIKRLAEGRNEFGVPLLSKIPYVNRLFRNVGIARATNSIMMMVTPRIIIQEEEEEKLGIAAP
jgi:general secretion pathway protein D